MDDVQAPEYPAARIPEEVLVRRWRRKQFFALGFQLSDARLLAESGVDLTEVRKLVAAGCPLATARSIVL